MNGLDLNLRFLVSESVVFLCHAGSGRCEDLFRQGAEEILLSRRGSRVKNRNLAWLERRHGAIIPKALHEPSNKGNDRGSFILSETSQEEKGRGARPSVGGTRVNSHGSE